MSFATDTTGVEPSWTPTAAAGQREDLSDLIHNIAPTETPMLTAAGTGKAAAVTHDWQEDSLEAPTDEPREEGWEPDVWTGSPTTRLSNKCQLNSKAVRVTGTLETVDKAGRDSEMAYQSALRAREIKTDVDVAIGGTNKPYGIITGLTGRNSASLLAYATNYVKDATDTAPTGDGTDSWAFPVTPPAGNVFDQADLDDAIEACWIDGGKPSLIVIGPFQKKKLSTFDGLGNAASASVTRSDRASRTIYATADVYVSNYGTLYVVPSRHVERSMSRLATGAPGTSATIHNVFLIDPEYLKIAYLRPWQQFDLAKVGDNVRRQILVEWTLEVSNRDAHAVIVDRTQT